MSPGAADIIRRLDLRPHPEGGHYRETYRHAPPDGGRGALTAIYYLLASGEASHWHRVTDAVEIWHWHSGAPLLLSVAAPGALARLVRLGGDVTADHAPHWIVPANHWQAARSLGDWTLVTCTVAPAFDFAGFEMAPKDFAPGKG
ncbi:MAG: cupin domain-containing protein [Alphaproteobacteria bacterium]|nr:cupin domain-containing protein [Alphaproteobacteria bacterium]